MRGQTAYNWQKHLDFMVLDVLCLQLAYALAYWGRFGLHNPYGDVNWRIIMLVMTLFDLLIMVFGKGLQDVLRRGYLKEMIALGKQLTALELFAIFFLFLTHQTEEYSRFVLLHTGIFCLFISFAARSAWKKLLRKHFRSQKRRVLLMGSSALAKRYASYAAEGDGLNAIEIVAHLAELPRLDIGRYGGGLNQLEHYLEEALVDMVVLAPSLEEERRLVEVVNLCEKYGTKLEVIPFYNDVISSNPGIEQIKDLKLLNFRATPLDEMSNAILKRTFDICASLVLILLSIPVMLFAAIGTRLSSPGPVLFRQERVGKDRKLFRMLNLRWMKTIDDSHREWAARRPVSCAARIIQKPERGFRHRSGHFRPVAAAERGAFRRPSEPAPIHRTA